MGRRYRKRRELIEWCRLDRDLLLGEYRKRYQNETVEKPADVLDHILTDMLEFDVLTAALPEGQMAALNFDRSEITVNSRMADFVRPNTDLPALVNSTKAHELGHIRLHEQELSMGLDRYSGYLPFPEPGYLPEPRELITYRDEDRSGLSPDERRREREADTYAAVFLVPEHLLMTLPQAHTILAAVNEGREIDVKPLWALIYRIARWFQVSPTLMKYRLMSLNLVEETLDGNICLSTQLRFQMDF